MAPSPRLGSATSRTVLRPVGPLLLTGLLLTSACGTADGPDASERSTVGTAAVAAAAATPTPSPPPLLTAEQAADPVVAARSELERLLGAHVLLADEVVRGQLTGREDLVRASAASVGRNTDEITEMVTSLAGAATGEQFRTAWERHVEVLGQFATALQEEDEGAQQTARSAYAAAEEELATALSAVVGGKVPLDALTGAATAHGEHLLGQAEAYADEDYARAYSLQRDAFAHMIVIADVLARGVAAAKGLPTTELDTPRRELHSALSRLLAEHMGLMVQALRAAHDEAPDLQAAGAALNGNTADLGAAVGTLFGPDASQQFLAVWAAHVEGLVKVAGSADPEEQQAGREAQAEYVPQLARFLAGATQGRASAIELAAALTIHDDHLLAMVDAYTQEDYPEAQQEADAGYAHMMALAGTLAVAIGETQAAQLPQGGPATGGGGHAGHH